MTTTTASAAPSDTTRPRLTVPRVYTTPGVHPFDEVEWARRDVRLTNYRDGSVNFEQTGVEFPVDWSVNAANIVTTKYMRGKVGTPQRETSFRDVVERIVSVYGLAAVEHGYLDTEQAEVLEHELAAMLIRQVFSFNSPVWFNVGVRNRPQVSACFILAVGDTMEEILDWYKEEGLIFRGGSGAGVNLSRIRSSKEHLSKTGGTASGPVSFMRGADASAGTIKSGGATRRAAKMVVLDVDHPDIEEFVATKVHEEEKIRALAAAGFDMGVDGKDMISAQYQNANNSVRVNDVFMRAVEGGHEYGLRARTTDEVIEGIDARGLWRQIAEAAWACADPGVQYDDAIQAWHTTPESGRITASNPCSEFLSNDNSSCNLASINLLKFLRPDGTFDAERFGQVVDVVFLAMDVSISFAGFPTEKIAQVTRDYRQLGIGYANLGALLMATGHGYDSDGGRNLAASITSLMTGRAWKRSAEIAAAVGPYAGFARNREAHLAVLEKHALAHDRIVDEGRVRYGVNDKVNAAATEAWVEALALAGQVGCRNAQASLLAPTGTIGLAMGCDTTGLEPYLGLKQYKKMVGGADMVIAATAVPLALERLKYVPAEVAQISAFVADRGHVEGAPGLKPEHYEVFDTALAGEGGTREIAPMGHLRMMGAVQPFLSGAISKTVNMPASSTVDDVADVYYQGWKLGLKAVAIYRNGSKNGQPLSTSKDKVVEVVEKVVERPKREKLPTKRRGQTVSFTVGALDGYLQTGEYDDGRLGEIFLRVSKQGSTLSGIMDSLAIAVSMGLQHGVPLRAYVDKYVNLAFEPAGLTNDGDLRLAKSVIDYVFRRLALDYLPFEDRSELGLYSSEERAGQVEGKTVQDAVDPIETSTPVAVANIADAPLCLACGAHMRQAGACYVCEQCGASSGCS